MNEPRLAGAMIPETASRLLELAIAYHKSEEGEGEYGCNGATCPGVQRLHRFAVTCAETALVRAEGVASLSAISHQPQAEGVARSPSAQVDDVEEWASERLANSIRIAGLKSGADRESWLEDVHYWQAIVARLRSAAPVPQSEPEVIPLQWQLEERTRERDEALAERAQRPIVTALKDQPVLVLDSKWGWVVAKQDSIYGWMSVPGRYSLKPTLWMEVPRASVPQEPQP